jgi:hypothetical protein
LQRWCFKEWDLTVSRLNNFILLFFAVGPLYKNWYGHQAAADSRQVTFDCLGTVTKKSWPLKKTPQLIKERVIGYSDMTSSVQLEHVLTTAEPCAQDQT